MRLRRAASLSQFTYSKPNDRGNIAKILNAVRNVIKIKYAGHPKVCSVGGGQNLDGRLKDSTRRDFGCTTEKFRRSVCLFMLR